MTVSRRVLQRVAGLALGLSACVPASRGDSQNQQEGSAEMSSSQDDLRALNQARIYFYHHSVGVNLLAGLQSLAAGQGTAPRLVDVEAIPADDLPGIIHGGGGKNGDPRGKIDVFASTIRQRAELRARLAFMKLCYVDITPHTNVDELFRYYQKTLQELKREHPELVFGHVTVPLVQRPTELKWTLYRLIGREVWADAANVKRYQYNQRLRETFRGDPIFDLAAVESTGPDGRRQSFVLDGRTYDSLHRLYTDDGGHLNPRGQRVGAAALVRFMASALARPVAAREEPPAAAGGGAPR
jgi:hypothetical protein